MPLRRTMADHSLEVGSKRQRTVEAGIDEHRFHDLVQDLDVIVWEADAVSWQFAFVSRRAEVILGYPLERWRQPDFWLSHLHPDDRDRVVGLVRAATAECRDHEFDGRMIGADERVVWLHHIVRVVTDDSGQPRLLRGVMIDVTARQQVEQALRYSEERVRALISAAPIVLFALDRHGVVTLCEGKGANLFGLSPEELIGRPVADVSVPQIVESSRAALGGESLSSLLEMNGLVFDLSLSPIRDEHGTVTGVMGVATDVTERKRVAAALRDEDEGSAALARIGQEVISTLDTSVLLNRLCQLSTEVIGCDCSLTWLWRPEDEAYAPVASYGFTPEEWESIRLLIIARAPSENWFARVEREDIVQEFAAASADHPFGRFVRGYRLTVRMYLPLRRGGKIIGYHAMAYRGRTTPFTLKQQGIAIGIAHLASMALDNARLVEELGRANRFKSDIVATIAHELRTPLNAILGYSDLLLAGEYGPLTPEQAEISRRVDRSAQVLRDLVSGTLELSRLDAGRLPLSLRDIDLIELIAEIDAETRELRSKPGVSFQWDVAPDLPRLYSDPLKLKVILKNLIGNAMKFTQKGSVSVAVEPVGSGVQFRVADTGIGIASETLPIIFEAFRQGESPTTRQYGGVGLGLYLVRRLVEVLGGVVNVESEVGTGSTFRVWLPLRHTQRLRGLGARRTPPASGQSAVTRSLTTAGDPALPPRDDH